MFGLTKLNLNAIYQPYENDGYETEDTVIENNDSYLNNINARNQDRMNYANYIYETETRKQHIPYDYQTSDTELDDSRGGKRKTRKTRKHRRTRKVQKSRRAKSQSRRYRRSRRA